MSPDIDVSLRKNIDQMSLAIGTVTLSPNKFHFTEAFFDSRNFSLVVLQKNHIREVFPLQFSEFKSHHEFTLHFLNGSELFVSKSTAFIIHDGYKIELPESQHQIILEQIKGI